MEYTVEASSPIAEPMREKEEEEEEGEGMEEEKRKGSSSTGDLAPQQAPALKQAMPTGLGFWLSGQSVQVARQGPTTSSKAQGKVPAIQVAPLPLEMDK